MEGVLCTCSLVCFVNIAFLLISSTVNASQGVFSEDVELFPFSFDKVSLYRIHEGNSPSPSPQPHWASPSDSPVVSLPPQHHNSSDHHPPRGKQPRKNGVFPIIPAKKGLNTGKIAGLVLVSIAGVLQVVVLAYLLVKRRQMLRVVEKYEV